MKYLKNKNEFVVYIYMYRFLNYFLIIYKEMSDNKWIIVIIVIMVNFLYLYRRNNNF